MGANDSTLTAAILDKMRERREQAHSLHDAGEVPHYYPTETVGVEEHARRCREGLVSSVTVTPRNPLPPKR